MSVDLNVLAPVTDVEQRMLDEAAATGWELSLEQLRESRRRGPNGLLVAQRLLKAGAADSLSAAGGAGKRSSSCIEDSSRCVGGG